jgi:hypothetical protein
LILITSSLLLHQIIITAALLPFRFSLRLRTQVWPEVYLIFALDTAYGDSIAGAIHTAFVSYGTGADNVHPFPPSIGEAYSWIKPSDAVLKSLVSQKQQQHMKQSKF